MCEHITASIAVDTGDMALLEPPGYILTAVAAKALLGDHFCWLHSDVLSSLPGNISAGTTGGARTRSDAVGRGRTQIHNAYILVRVPGYPRNCGS
eukprot:2616283-Prymnesium_polylepis.1